MPNDGDRCFETCGDVLIRTKIRDQQVEIDKVESGDGHKTPSEKKMILRKNVIEN